MEMLCSSYQCVIETSVFEELRQGYDDGVYTWRPGNTSAHWGHSLQEGVMGLLGTVDPSHSSIVTTVQSSYDPDMLPRQFSSVSTWPGLVSGVSDQGWCGVSWSQSALSVMEDRTSIMQGRRVTLTNARPGVTCGHGSIDLGWDRLRSAGVSQPAYRVRRRTEDIMHEIMTQGPVQTVIRVYTDLFMYAGGVYRVTNLGRGRLAGYHALRMVGWGEEAGLKYWTLVNSWGEDWGERGHLRLVRGENECGVEETVVAAWPVTHHHAGHHHHRGHRGGAAGYRRQRHRGRHHRHRQRHQHSERRGRRRYKKKYYQVG